MFRHLINVNGIKNLAQKLVDTILQITMQLPEIKICGKILQLYQGPLTNYINASLRGDVNLPSIYLLTFNKESQNNLEVFVSQLVPIADIAGICLQCEVVSL